VAFSVFVLRWPVALGALAALLTGCAGDYVARTRGARQAYESYRYPEAAQGFAGEVASGPQIDTLLSLMDDGMVLHASGRLEESIQVLAQADKLSERLDFTSVRLVPAGAARVTRLAYRWDVASGDGFLENAVGRRVSVNTRGDRVTEGTLVASDGAQALAILGERAAEIDVVVLDLSMPGASGREVLGKIRERWPALPVVIMSGDTSDRAGLESAADILDKPLTRAPLQALSRVHTPPQKYWISGPDLAAAADWKAGMSESVDCRTVSMVTLGCSFW